MIFIKKKKKLFTPWLHITTEDYAISTFLVPLSLTPLQSSVPVAPLFLFGSTKSSLFGQLCLLVQIQIFRQDTEA